MKHTHWEIDSQCPHCDNINHVKIPVGELVTMVNCQHCTHGYHYTHFVREHTEVED